MDPKKKAFQIIYDITGIVIKWDKKQLTDKQAMQEIVDTLATDAEEKKFNSTKYKNNFIKTQKSIIAPLIIGSLVLGIFIGGSNPFLEIRDGFTNNEEISFEQLNEINLRSDQKIQNKSSIEEFDNKTIPNKD